MNKRRRIIIRKISSIFLFIFSLIPINSANLYEKFINLYFGIPLLSLNNNIEIHSLFHKLNIDLHFFFIIFSFSSF